VNKKLTSRLLDKAEFPVATTLDLWIPRPTEPPRRS